MNYNKFNNLWEDKETNQFGKSRTELRANIKIDNLGIPKHDFLSNRYVLNKVKDGS